MKYQKFFHFLQNVGKDPSAIFFEDELTRLKNRRFLLNYFKNEIDWQGFKPPVSLLLIDIDHFKRLNEQYGEEAGDQALVHVSTILKDTARVNAIPIRYAGDEFILLLLDTPKPEALETAEKLLNNIHYNLFFSADADTAIPVTLSIGIASAPDDAASGNELIHQADTALYAAKQSGRNRYVDIGAVTPEAVSHKTAIHYLDNASIVGRKSQFKEVGNALQQLGRSQQGFLVVDGAPGMGKTSFLDLVQRNLAKTHVNMVRIAGALQESYRPYYLISYIAMAMMNQREDKGKSVLDAMDDEAIYRLAHVIPQLIDAEEPPPEDDAAHREAIFRSFCDFFTALMNDQPLILLIDDFDYSDPASLHLLQTIFNEQPVPILICGTASQEVPTRPQAIPLEIFRNAYSEALGIRDITLTALTAEDINKHVNMIFPGIKFPRRTAHEMAALTEGNPLFITEILRKMANDQKIFQEGSKWRIAAIEKNYFPRSLEEIIQQKMALLDEESRQFVDRASAFGETTSLSMIAGFSKKQSAKIYDCLNQALAQGIVRSDFNETDESIRFSSKRVRDTIYEDISPEVRATLEDQIGSYKEDLYNRQLLPSKTIAAHHFSLGGDPEKARAYQESLADYHLRTFNPDEALTYPDTDTGEPDEGVGGEAAIADTPLSKNARNHIPSLLRAMVVAVRNTRLYPPQSKSVVDSVNQLLALIRQILSTDERLSIILEKNALLVNQEPLDITPYPTVAEKIMDLWDRLELNHLTFVRGISAEELTTLIHKISQTERKSIKPSFWRSFQSAYPMPHIIVGQIVYQKMDTPKSPAAPTTPQKSAREIKDMLDPADSKIVRQIIGSLLGAVNKLKLYPAEGPVATEAIQSLHAELQPFFEKNGEMTIGRVENAILINGLKMDSSGFEALTSGFIKFLAEAGLQSITLLPPVTADELTRFIAIACQADQIRMNDSFWHTHTDAQKLQNIRPNEGVYGIREIFPADLATDDDNRPADDSVEQQQKASPPGAQKIIAEDDLDPETLPARLRDMFLTGEFDHAQAILDRLCADYKNSDASGKQAIIRLFDAILNPVDWKPSAAFIRFVLSSLLAIFETETEPDRLNDIAQLCYEAAKNFILFGEFSLAAWVTTHISRHPERSRIKAPEMPANVLEAAIYGLAAGNNQQQQSAFELLSGMGTAVRPYLLNVIKQDIDLRVRRLAAQLIKHQGPEGAAAVKRALTGEHFAEDRARILDVIDAVTEDIQTELSFALSDAKKVVRRAGGRLAERMNSPAVRRMLVELAQRENPETAAAAINLLGRLKDPEAADTLTLILDQSENEAVMTAACRAMGQIGDDAFILPLQNVLRARRGILFRKSRSSQIRVAAAYAIAQINDPRSEKILNALKKDKDPRVREAARNLTD